MKKKLKILHSAFFSIYFLAGIQRPASSICSEYRLSSLQGQELQLATSATFKMNNNDLPALFNMSLGFSIETNRDTNDSIARVSTATQAVVLKGGKNHDFLTS